MRADQEPALEEKALFRAKAARHAIDRGNAREVSELGEIYLELAALDLDDKKAILAFVQRYGVLGVAHERFSFFRELPGFSTVVQPALAAAWPTRQFEQTEEDYLELRGDSANSSLVETLEEFRFGARCLRDLTEAARIAELDEQPEQAEWLTVSPHTLESLVYNELLDQQIVLEPREVAIDIFLRYVLNDGLRPFHPRVHYVGQDPVKTLEALSLYAVCCLEIFNHLQEHAKYLRCANATCQRVFVRQRGRAQHGQHRSRGVKYCSRECARAQSQRQYRNRQKTQHNT